MIYRKINTRRGIYFVAWRPDDVAQLFINEKLVPADLLCNKSREIHHLIRDLYLLACAGALNVRQSRQKNTSLLTRYVRELHSSLTAKH